MLIADSHEFIELYRGDKDLRMGIEMVALRPDVRFVSFAARSASPNDRDAFGIRTADRGPLPVLPDRMELRLLPSLGFRFRRKESGGIAAVIPTIGSEIRRLRPDVILENPFSWLTPRSYQTHAVARSLGIPMIYYDPGDDIPISRKQRLLAVFEREVVNDARRIITYNQAGRSRFMRKYGYPAERIRVIPKPIDVLAVRFTGDTSPCRERIGASDPSTLVVGYIGRLTRSKASAALLAVAERATGIPLLRDARFLFIGGALSSSETDDAYRRENTYVTGMLPHDDVAEYIACCDVIVFPDLTNPGAFPTAVAEAMAAGKPLILGLGTHREFVPNTDGVDALMVEPDAPDDILRALCLLAEDQELRMRIGAGAARFADRHMDYPVVARAYLDLIDEALSE